MLQKLFGLLRGLKRGFIGLGKPGRDEPVVTGKMGTPEPGAGDSSSQPSDEGTLVWVSPGGQGEAGRRGEEAGVRRQALPAGVLAHPADDGGGGETDAIIGLDFGTSCCKVVVRFPFLQGEPAYPVRFNIEDDCPLLLPTEVHWAEDGGELRLKPFKGSVAQKDLKVALWKRPDEENSKQLALGYLALVMKLARDWIIKEKSDELGGVKPLWFVNVGIPSIGPGDKGMWDTFHKTVKAAWELSFSGKKVTVAAADKALRGDFYLDAPSDIELRAEVIAEVQGYCRSHMKRDGLHLMVDVGASTLDVCGFNIFETRSGDNVHTLLTPVVEDLGVNALRERKPAWAKSVRKNTVVANDEFGKECFRAIYISIHRLKTGMDPFAPVFTQGEQLRVFLCGGGGQLKFYEKVVAEVSARCDDRWLNFGGLFYDPVPMPGSVEWPSDVEEEYYRRMAVAFGLAFSDEEVGHIIPSSEVEAIQPRSRIESLVPVGKEQV